MAIKKVQPTTVLAEKLEEWSRLRGVERDGDVMPTKAVSAGGGDGHSPTAEVHVQRVTGWHGSE